MVSIANTKAWITATINSRTINGSGATMESIPYIVPSTLSPAKILPKSLNEKEMNFMNSFTNSRMPTNKNIGNILKDMNLDI